METREFQSPADLAPLPQTMILNCTGYGARALWSYESVISVRGQIAWLIPQEGISYRLMYKNLNVLARRDGIGVQPSPQGENTGWNESDEQQNRAEAEAAVLELKELYDRMAKMPRNRSAGRHA